ncbi:hypothetical protein N7462_008965 [Penicillium macrosclerotiorum]|uniref:uncharacterized protein n=1 Tax=Penicillium macrosclerotiorum TaxID=303699 RepID=UPI00254755F5|nr:uncharacterized protein N7462_008965 [Penicillium macrosclerotiorum]KAJ5676068.1 hypothetical protein N7462_008965 [Penicillium macrosclerotiorum]
MPSLRSRKNNVADQMPETDIYGAGQMPNTKHDDVAQSSRPSSIANPEFSCNPETPLAVFTSHDGSKAAGSSSPPAANVTPPEILLQIYSMLTPRDFDNARRTCSQWMRVSLNRHLLEGMLKRAGWWDAYLQDATKQQIRRRSSGEESDVWKMSRRFATECLLSGRKSNVERPGFITSEVIDFSGLSQGLSKVKAHAGLSHILSKAARNEVQQSPSTFSISSCGNYLLVTAGCMIYVFQLLQRTPKFMSSVDSNDTDLVPITSISCPYEVLSATLDTTTPRSVIAALLRNRIGMVCDVDLSESRPSTNTSVSAGLTANTPQTPLNSNSINNISPHYYYNVCSEDHPPRTIALCPGRRCVAFGCARGIEVHWVDETTGQDQRRNFPMSQPSEILHFLPSTPESPMELRLISSLTGPGSATPPNTSNLSLVRATHCHHYRAVPINDGFHIIFVEPRTGLLCIGSDAPIGGPTSLTRAFVCVPPFGKDGREFSDNINNARVPTVFTVGSDLSWGLRVVAAYNDRIVLYSVPLDVFNVIRKERERQGDGVMGDSDLARDWFVDTERFRKRRESLVQNQNGDWEFLLSVSYRPTAMMWPFKIYGKEIGRVDNLVELALQSSSGGARIWAFSAAGEARVFDVDTVSSAARTAADIPCKIVTVGPDGRPASSRLIDRSELGSLSLRGSRKRKAAELRDAFAGRYGTSRFVPSMALGGFEPSGLAATAMAQSEEPTVRRPSFAACIVDFKIPELGPREGRWRADG